MSLLTITRGALASLLLLVLYLITSSTIFASHYSTNYLTDEDQAFIEKITPILEKYANTKPVYSRAKFILAIHDAVVTKYNTIPLENDATKDVDTYLEANKLYLISLSLEEVLIHLAEKDATIVRLQKEFEQLEQRGETFAIEFCEYACHLDDEYVNVISKIEQFVNSVNYTTVTAQPSEYSIALNEIKSAINSQRQLALNVGSFRGSPLYKDAYVAYIDTLSSIINNEYTQIKNLANRYVNEKDENLVVQITALSDQAIAKDQEATKAFEQASDDFVNNIRSQDGQISLEEYESFASQIERASQKYSTTYSIPRPIFIDKTGGFNPPPNNF